MAKQNQNQAQEPEVKSGKFAVGDRVSVGGEEGTITEVVGDFHSVKLDKQIPIMKGNEPALDEAGKPLTHSTTLGCVPVDALKPA